MRIVSSLITRTLSTALVRVTLGLMLAGAMMSPCGSSAFNQAEKPIWMGQTGGFAINWTTTDITITPAGKPTSILFSARALAQENLETFKKDSIGDSPNPECEYEQRFSRLSVVGHIVSYDLREYSYCKDPDGRWAWAHPNVASRYSVVDLNNPGKPVILTSLFPEASILNALLGDPLVKRALADRGSSAYPRTLADFTRLIKDSTPLELKPGIGTARAPRECSFLFPDDFLSQFSFHHVEDGRVAIRLSLEPSVGACRTAHAELGLLLTIPKSLEQFALEDRLRQGFLQKDHLKLFGSQHTLIKFHLEPSKRDE